MNGGGIRSCEWVGVGGREVERWRVGGWLSLPGGSGIIVYPGKTDERWR